MTKAVFIATAEPYSGKSLVLLRLVNRLLGQARRVGYFKPLTCHDPAIAVGRHHELSQLPSALLSNWCAQLPGCALHTNS